MKSSEFAFIMVGSTTRERKLVTRVWKMAISEAEAAIRITKITIKTVEIITVAMAAGRATTATAR